MKLSQNGKTAQQIAEEKEQAIVASADSAVRTPKKGMFQRISDWWQRNTREIRLVKFHYTVVSWISTYLWVLNSCFSQHGHLPSIQCNIT